jgi:hypothetical protein
MPANITTPTAPPAPHADRGAPTEAGSRPAEPLATSPAPAAPGPLVAELPANNPVPVAPQPINTAADSGSLPTAEPTTAPAGLQDMPRRAEGQAPYSVAPAPRGTKFLMPVGDARKLYTVRVVKLVTLYGVEGFGLHQNMSSLSLLGREWMVSHIATGASAGLGGSTPEQALSDAAQRVAITASRAGKTPKACLRDIVASQKGPVTTLSIDVIRRDGGTQPRTAIDDEIVREYADYITAGVKFPPLRVFWDGSTHWLADGFHRVAAYLKAGVNAVECEVYTGTQQDAQWYSFSANKAHGLRRNNADKQQAVRAALAHDRAAGLSDAMIAEHVGVSDRMIAEHRKAITPNGSESNRRTGRDGRTIDTAKIGRRKSESLPKRKALDELRTKLEAGKAARAENALDALDPEVAQVEKLTDGLRQPVIVQSQKPAEEPPKPAALQTEEPVNESSQPVIVQAESLEELQGPIQIQPPSLYRMRRGQAPAAVANKVDRVETLVKKLCCMSYPMADAFLYCVIERVHAVRNQRAAPTNAPHNENALPEEARHLNSEASREPEIATDTPPVDVDSADLIDDAETAAHDKLENAGEVLAPIHEDGAPVGDHPAAEQVKAAESQPGKRGQAGRNRKSRKNKPTGQAIRALADAALSSSGGRCQKCGVSKTNIALGRTETGVLCYREYLLHRSWRNAETGAPVAEPVEHDGSVPESAELVAYFIKSKNTVVVRCARHKPSNGKKVEVQS